MQTREQELKAVQMLGLKLPTDPRWVNLAEMDLQEILTDHAYCEQKAATSCISLIQQFPDKTELVEELAPIVTEEWGHFRMVLRELKKRGLALGRQRKDEYVAQLAQLERKGSGPDLRFLDKLLICALIEARSCERFRLLSLHIADEELRQFYHDLMISEAGHYTNFIKLAKDYLPEAQVKQRLEELLEAEAEIIARLEVRDDRMH
ncbi:MAG: tRNA-(ms[2]io[6]A)-hydroxylase [Microscillaceae bacterium]|nr:tRNA-(ms[2]io[6]A)-hydroxylase [Microscillaceae bacterium]